MAEPTDHELLTRFARTGDEAAFAALVQRHVNLVWSAARRFTGDDTLAGEVTQAVFIILAQKAGRLSAKIILTGWLYQTARLTAANALKENRRRQHREHQAYMESTLNRGGDASSPTANESIWQQLAPVLDEAMHALRTADRDAVLLRYFENKSLADVGAALGVSEDAARVRVNRALDKLRALLAKQGIQFDAGAIAAAVTANAVSAAPAALAASITTAVLTGTSLTLTTIAMTTLQKIAVTAALTVTIGGGLFAAKQAHDAQNEVRTLQAQLAPLTEQIHQLQAERDKATNQIAGLNEELAKNKKNNLELLKLRGELGVLGNQLLQAKHQTSHSAGVTSKSSLAAAHRPGAYIESTNLMFVGYATPEASLESTTWAMTFGTYEQATNGLNPKMVAEENKDSQAKQKLENDQTLAAKVLVGMQIMAKKTLADDRVEIKVRMAADPQLLKQFSAHMPPEFMLQPMVKIGDEWKLGGSSHAWTENWDQSGQIETYSP